LLIYETDRQFPPNSQHTNQQNSENPQAYVDTIFQADKEHIQTLKDEITFLRKLLEAKENV
jgi:hypothetical protein